MYFTWSSLCLLDMQINPFHQIWEVFSHNFFKFIFGFYFFFWYSHYAYVGACNASHISLRLCSFFPPFFSSLRLHNFYQFIFMFADSSSASLYLLSCSIVNCSIIVFFNSRISIWLFFKSFFFLFTHILYLIRHFHQTSLYFIKHVFFFCSFAIIIMSALKSLIFSTSGNSQRCFFCLLVLCVCDICLFLCMSYSFVLVEFRTFQIIYCSKCEY